MKREKFFKLVDEKLNQIEKIFVVKGANNNNDPERLILFVLDQIKRGNFDGIISLKIKDTKIYDPMISEQKVSLQRTYIDI